MVKWPKKIRINYCQAGFRDSLEYLEKQASQAEQGGGYGQARGEVKQSRRRFQQRKGRGRPGG